MSKNYIIEGNIDFYSKIKLNNEDEINKDTDDYIDYDNICLITGEPLVDKYVSMSCGHKFNYVPLYNDLFNQKYCSNIREEYRLKVNEIRCPYCRIITQKLIPFYENFCIADDVFVRKIIGVNDYDTGDNAIVYCGHLYLKEKTLWEQEQGKIIKFKKKNAKEDAKQAKLKAKDDAKTKKKNN